MSLYGYFSLQCQSPLGTSTTCTVPGSPALYRPAPAIHTANVGSATGAEVTSGAGGAGAMGAAAVVAVATEVTLGLGAGVSVSVAVAVAVGVAVAATVGAGVTAVGAGGIATVGAGVAAVAGVAVPSVQSHPMPGPIASTATTARHAIPPVIARAIARVSRTSPARTKVRRGRNLSPRGPGSRLHRSPSPIGDVPASLGTATGVR